MANMGGDDQKSVLEGIGKSLPSGLTDDHKYSDGNSVFSGTRQCVPK